MGRVRVGQFSINADRLLLTSGNIYLCLVSQEALIENALNPGPADNIVTGPPDRIVTGLVDNIIRGLADSISTALVDNILARPKGNITVLQDRLATLCMIRSVGNIIRRSLALNVYTGQNLRPHRPHVVLIEI